MFSFFFYKRHAKLMLKSFPILPETQIRSKKFLLLAIFINTTILKYFSTIPTFFLLNILISKFYFFLSILICSIEKIKLELINSGIFQNYQLQGVQWDIRCLVEHQVFTSTTGVQRYMRCLVGLQVFSGTSSLYWNIRCLVEHQVLSWTSGV